MNVRCCTWAMVSCLVISNTASVLAFSFQQQGVQPVYQFEIFANSGLIPGTEDVTLDFDALGTVDITIDDADLLAFSLDPSLPIPLAAASGTFGGKMPAGTVVPEGSPFTLRALELVSGRLENVTVDGMGSITGADATFTLLFSQDVLPGTPDEVRLFGAEMTFTGAIDSVPFSVGTSFVSPDPVGLFLGGLDGDQVGLVKNRFLNIVPEPTSLVIASLTLIGGVATARWRRAN